MSEADNPVDVQQLMQQIRRQILDRRGAAGDEAAQGIVVGGKRLPPEFYDRLYQAGLAYNLLRVDQQVRQSAIPLLGPLLDRAKRALHLLVIFYVNQVAERQQLVNRHLLQALSILSEELERQEDAAP